MSRLGLPVGSGTTALRVGRLAAAVLGIFVMWAVCALLLPDFLPHWQLWLARIGLPAVLAFYVVLVVWVRREAAAPPCDPEE